MTKVEFIEYFKSNKSDWIPDQSLGENLWDEDLVLEFWKRMREYTSTFNDWNFEGFIFPKFETRSSHLPHEAIKEDRSFWKENCESIFEQGVSFNNCTFLGFCDFENVKFYEKADFRNSKFISETSFNFAEFKRGVSFSLCQFQDSIFFFKSKFARKSFFYKTEFWFQANFIETEFSDTVFQEIAIGEKDLLFEEIVPIGFPSISFIDSKLNQNVVFRKSNMTAISFFRTDLTNAKFFHCDWTCEKSNRIQFLGENFVDNEEIYLENRSFTFEELEDVYRQIKKVFEANKNSELSGYAYTSEMEMRRKRLWKEGSYISCFFYWFYSFFAGYTQNFIRPFIILSLSVLIVFPFIYFVVDCHFIVIDLKSVNVPTIQNNQLNDFCGNSFRKSIEASFPFIKSTLKSKYWGIVYFETILNSTFLTFFILALRKRFKQ